jgi:hypothetical protein
MLYFLAPISMINTIPLNPNNHNSHAHFLDFVPMTFGRHLQLLGDKSRLVFDSLHSVPESQAKKALYVSLKLLPSLIRRMLIHGNYRPF